MLASGLSAPAERQRRLRGYPQLAWHLARAFALVPRWRLTQSATQRRAMEQRFFARSLSALGVEPVFRGKPVREAGTLYLANHISFSDVLALGWHLDALFVAKADVRAFPLLGPLADGHGTIFIERTRRSDSLRQAERIGAALASGRSLVLFPEGTTSDGSDVLPFRPALLAAARHAGAVQPIALSYSDSARRAYMGEETLVANLLRLARWPARLTITFLTPIRDARAMDRKALAAEARQRITLALAAHRRAAD